MTLLREGRGHCSGFETTMRNKRGSEIPVLMSARVTGDRRGILRNFPVPGGLERQIKKALKESEEKFREMVSSSGDGL